MAEFIIGCTSCSISVWLMPASTCEKVLRNPVDFGRQDKIALREAIDLVGVSGDFGFAPGKQDIRVMALFLGDGAGAVHEIESLLKIRELQYLVQMVLFDHLPIGQFRLERIQRIAFEWRNVAAAGNAG